MKNILALFISCYSFIASAQQTVQKKDEKFAKTATETGLMEVMIGQLAQSNATTDRLKTHAQRMIDDHSTANEELKNIAIKKNIVLPGEVNNSMQKKYDKMTKLTGVSFNKKYSKQMIKDHKKAICLYKKEARKSKDPELRTWAAENIPTLKHHLDMWREASKSAKG